MDKNKGAYQYQESIEVQFKSICEPLFNLGLKWFAYIKIFPDGSYLFIAPIHKEFTKQYFSTINGQGASLTLEIGAASIDQSHYCMYSSQFLFPKKRIDPVLDLMYSFRLWPMFLILRNRSEFVESYDFGMDPSDEYATQFYLNNLPLLERFCDYFSEQAKEILDCSDRRKLGYFDQTFNFQNKAEENSQVEKIKQFLQETYIQKRNLKIGEKELFFSKEEMEGMRYLNLGENVKVMSSNLGIPSLLIENSLRTFKNLESKEKTQKRSSHYLQTSLSVRQNECLFYLVKGYTAKQTAQKLGCSHRTIETHIDHIKNKLKCTTKGQLIELAFENGFVETNLINGENCTFEKYNKSC
jgi:DNA-binding CsgD family transcriptional regulator